MKDLCLLSCGRWSAIIREADVGAYSSHDDYLDVTVSCDFDCFDRYLINLPMKARYEMPRDEDKERSAFILYAGSLGISVSSGDFENARFLFHVADKLCLHILNGGSVEEWCEGVGLKPVTEWMPPRDRREPCSLIVTVLGAFFIVPRRFFLTSKGKATTTGK